MLLNNYENNNHIWCAIPVFNNKNTIRQVAKECLDVLKNVVVIDDGSTDTDIALLLADLDLIVLKHEKNLGKGEAILNASRYIENHGGSYMITIDADGQHYPKDIENFFPLIKNDGDTLIIGCRNFDTDNVPDKSRFGRKFANFWLRLETGIQVDDCQSGFRAYPVTYLNKIQFKGFHYDFEAEVLAKAAWAGLKLNTVSIDVYYPKPIDRISHFKPFRDNLRISIIHAMLVGIRLLPLRHKKLVHAAKRDLSVFRNPGKVLMMLLKENATPEGLAISAAVGILIGTLPLLFIHTIVIIYVATRLNLNKILAVNVQHLCMPPFVPVLCIQMGYYLKHGKWLTNVSFKMSFTDLSARIGEWFLGSLIVAPIGATVIGIIIFFSARVIKKRAIVNA